MVTIAQIVWTNYVKQRARLRDFSLEEIEKILRYSTERYFDTATNRFVVVGNHKDLLVLIPYEKDQGKIFPVTIHAITRQQINIRVKTGRFTYE